MLNEFKNIIDPKKLPSRRKYLHYYIVGLIDCKGFFSVSIKKQNNAKFGWAIDPVFYVTQDKENRQILEILKAVFKCGRIIPKQGQEDSVLQYIVDARKNLAEKIVPFFKKHKPIIKWREFEAFAEIVEALEKGEHKNINGFKKLIAQAYKTFGEKKYQLNEVLSEIERRMGASETIRRAL